MKNWKTIWVGVASTWMLTAGFFFSMGAMEGVLHRSVLGVEAFYDSETLYKVWRYEARDFMIHARIPGKRRGTYAQVPKDSVAEIDKASNAETIVQAQNSWLETYPGAFVTDNEIKIMATDKFPKMVEHYQAELATISKVWMVSWALFLLPPLITYLLLMALMPPLIRKYSDN